MRRRVTLLIVRSEEILIISRFREGRAYYVIPGGGVEDGETLEEAALREAREETSLEIILGPQVWQRECGEQIEYAFLVRSFTGVPQLGGPEFVRQAANNNYRLEWIPLSLANQLSIYPGMIELELLAAACKSEPPLDVGGDAADP